MRRNSRRRRQIQREFMPWWPLAALPSFRPGAETVDTWIDFRTARVASAVAEEKRPRENLLR